MYLKILSNDDARAASSSDSGCTPRVAPNRRCHSPSLSPRAPIEYDKNKGIYITLVDRGLRMEFSLPKDAYATTVLREIMKP